MNLLEPAMAGFKNKPSLKKNLMKGNRGGRKKFGTILRPKDRRGPGERGRPVEEDR